MSTDCRSTFDILKVYLREVFSVVLGEMQFYLLLITNHTSQLSGILQAPTLYECFYLSSVIAIQKIESLTNFDLEYAVKTKCCSLQLRKTRKRVETTAG